MYNNNQNHHNDNNMNKDGSTIIYPEFIPISKEIKAGGSTNSYLNNIRREMLSMVNNGNNVDSNSNNDSIIININTINNNSNNNHNNSSIDINKSGYSQISNATSNDNLNKTLLENNEISQINDIDQDDDSSPEFIRYNKFIGSLSYITFIGAAIVLINQKKSVFIQFHAYQSFYISMGVIGFQFLLIWSDILSIILWSLYLLFTIFMFLKVSFGGYGNSTIYKLPIIGDLSEKKAKLRSQEYSRYFKYHENLFIKELREHQQSLIRRSNLNRNNNSNILNNNSNNVNSNGHQRINSNSSSVMMSSDVESMLNSSGSNSSIYSDVQNDIGTNEE
ncbi:hypothetical protein ACTFIU_004701 [Dictyostelium citrinum]